MGNEDQGRNRTCQYNWSDHICAYKLSFIVKKARSVKREGDSGLGVAAIPTPAVVYTHFCQEAFFMQLTLNSYQLMPYGSS